MTFDRWTADLTLAEIDAVLVRNRRRVGRLRAPLVSLAVLLSCCAVWAVVAGRDHLAVFYGPGLLVVAGLAGVSARRDAAVQGVQVHVWPWIAMATALLVLSASASRLATLNDLTTLSVVGPSLVFAAGIVSFGAWVRRCALCVAGICMASFASLSPLVASGDACVALQLAFFAAVLGAVSVVASDGTARP